jgi:hypothetical protein
VYPFGGPATTGLLVYLIGQAEFIEGAVMSARTNEPPDSLKRRTLTAILA